MKRWRFTLPAVVLIALASAVAALGSAWAGAAPSGADERSPSVTRAVITVSTPTLPAGQGLEARQRWRELRDRSAGILGRLGERHDLAVERRIPEAGLLVVALPPGGIGALRDRLAGDARVEAIAPDLRVRLLYAPNDYAFTHPDVHAPNNDFGNWNLSRYGATAAWDISKGTGAEVAAIDSGADGSHPDLAPRIVGSQGFGASLPTVDTNGHGTHTAGLACGDTDNGIGVASLGFDCGLFIEKIGFACSDVARALTAAANRNSDVISMSIGGCPNNTLNSALDYALSRGSVLVAAADNEPNPSGSCGLGGGNDCLYPAQWIQPLGTGPQAGFNRGLVVTAAKYDGTRASFAEATTRVSVAAFGAATDAIGGQQGILSTWPPTTVSSDSSGGRTTVGGDNRYAYLVGTSMATPQVAGLAALIRAANPTLSAPDVASVIKATAGQCGTYGGGLGWGVIQAGEAVASAVNRDVIAPSSTVTRAKRSRKGIKLRLSKQDKEGATCIKRLLASGVKQVLVFASANGGRYHQIAKTTKAKVRFRGKPGRRYRFYSIAVDNAGNREAAPSVPDARARLKKNRRR